MLLFAWGRLIAILGLSFSSPVAPPDVHLRYVTTLPVVRHIAYDSRCCTSPRCTSPRHCVWLIGIPDPQTPSLPFPDVFANDRTKRIRVFREKRHDDEIGNKEDATKISQRSEMSQRMSEREVQAWRLWLSWHGSDAPRETFLKHQQALHALLTQSALASKPQTEDIVVYIPFPWMMVPSIAQRADVRIISPVLSPPDQPPVVLQGAEFVYLEDATKRVM